MGTDLEIFIIPSLAPTTVFISGKSRMKVSLNTQK